MTQVVLMGPRQVGAAAGVSADTIRHYERHGLIPPAMRTRAGHRRYPPDTVMRVAIVRRALAMGFSLKDLAAIFRDRDRGAAPCRRVRGIVADRLSKIDGEIAALRKLKSEMAALLEDWDARLSATPPGRQARLLDSLAGKRRL
jgi:DNA-binding transcriptional MerR regulator